MEPTSSPDNGRQSRGLARFWPVHGMPAPGQRHSDEDPEEPDGQPDQQVSGPPAVSAFRVGAGRRGRAAGRRDRR